MQTIERIKREIRRKIPKPVLPEGKPSAKLMLIGEAGGAEEERAGKPFVGRAGKFLDSELRKFGIKRDAVYITNVVKYRCIGPPKKQDIEKCAGWLERELKAVKPELVVLLGKTAQKHTPRLKGIKYIELPHPAAAMRFPRARKEFERGMLRVQRLLNKLK